MDIQSFNALVEQMLSSVNEDRTIAEKQYDALDLAAKVNLLYMLYPERGAQASARSMCLVLLRRLFTNNWDELQTALGSQLVELLKFCLEEDDISLRKKLTDVVAEVARNEINDENGKQMWSEVLQFLDHCIKTDSADLKLTAMILIEAVPNIFGSDQDKYLQGIKTLLEACLMHANSSVRSAAAKAFVAFITMNDDDDKLVKGFVGSVPAIIQICNHIVETEEDDDSPLQALSDLASCVPKIITPHVAAIIEMSARVVANKDKDSSYRHSAMEVLTSICEAAPNTVKKRHANYIPVVLQSALLLMTEMDDDDTEEWLSVDDVESGDLDEDGVAVGESSLDRISCTLNGKAIFDPFLQIAQQYLQANEWQKRHAAIMGFSTIGEGSKRTMEPKIGTIVDHILPYLQDPHPRVRYAACNCLGQMSTDFAPTLQKKCHERVVAGLLHTLEDTSIARVSAHAGAALVNFSEDCPQNVITSYLAVIMAKLEAVIESTFSTFKEKGKKIILEQVITTVASVADASKEVFIQFYDRLMPPLKYILQNTNIENCQTLRGKTIECISLIGLAVGKEKFGADAIEIMNILSGSMSDLCADDPQCSYMISSWTRICRVLGPDFAQFLPMVMDPILRAAAYTPAVQILSDDQVEEQDDQAWEYHSVGDGKQFGIRTSGLEEKATACEMLVCYARDMKEAFIPYVDRVAEMMVLHLKFMFHDGVRSAAAETLPCLLECVKSQGIDAMRRLWNGFYPALLESAGKHEEEDPDVLSDVLSSICECINVLKREGVTAEEVQKMGALISEQLDAYEKRRANREAEEADEDEDPEEAKEHLDEELQEETCVLARISDIVHVGFKEFGEDFYPMVHATLPNMIKLIDTKRHYADRQWGVCMLDDIVEFAPKKVAEYQHQFIPLMINCLNDEYPEVRQAAAYGFGVMAMNGGAEYITAVTSALEPLAAMISKPDARSTEEGTIATENAIAAVAKILKYAGSQVDITQAIPTFISWLPTHEDQEESIHIYGYFCDLVEQNHPALLGENNTNLPKILDIAVSAFHLDAFDDEPESAEVQSRVLTIIKQLHVTNMIEHMLPHVNFDEDKKATLKKLLS